MAAVKKRKVNERLRAVRPLMLNLAPLPQADDLVSSFLPSDDVMVKLRFSEKPIHREPCRRTDATSIGSDAT